MNHKLRIGWFTFTCCEDSAIIFTEILNNYWPLWKDKIEFVHAKVLRKDPDEIKPILERFRYKEKVLRVSDLVRVDDSVPGCPMDENKFLSVMDKYLNQQ